MRRRESEASQSTVYSDSGGALGGELVHTNSDGAMRRESVSESAYSFQQDGPPSAADSFVSRKESAEALAAKKLQRTEEFLMVPTQVVRSTSGAAVRRGIVFTSGTMKGPSIKNTIRTKPKIPPTQIPELNDSASEKSSDYDEEVHTQICSRALERFRLYALLHARHFTPVSFL
jgi:hypothetical protein